jgi:hypothetical protein
MIKRVLFLHVVAYSLYLLAAVIITWPLAMVFSTELLGHPFADSYEYTRHIWWISHALRSGQPLFDQPLLAYPRGLAGAWLWGSPLQSFPAWLLAFALPLPAAFNLAALLTLALNGWAMHWLAWKLTRARGAAFIAGLVFMAYPHFQGQLGAGHTGLLVLWPAPLYAWGLWRLVSGAASWRLMALTALGFVVSLWGNLLLIVYLTGPLTIFFMLLVLARRDWRALARVSAAAGLGGLLALPFFLPVMNEALNAPPWLREGGDVAYSADLLGLATPSYQHPLFTHLPYTHTVLGIDPFERVSYMGLAAGLLILLAVARQRAARPWLLLALVAWVLSLGPLLKILDSIVALRLGDYSTGVTLPWLALGQLPLLNITRTPARFNFSIAFAAAVMAGYGAQALIAALSPRLRRAEGVALALIAALILFDYQFFWPFPTIPGTVPEPVAALRNDARVRAVLDLPWAHPLAAKDGLFLQTGHQKPLLAGHVTRRTPVDPAMLSVLEDTLDPALLDAAGVDVVILHQRWDKAGAAGAALRSAWGSPFYEDALIAVWYVPDADSAPALAYTTGTAQAFPPQTDDALAVYIHAPQAGFARLRADLAAADRPATLYLNGTPVYRLVVDGHTAPDLPLPLTGAGYHTVRLALEPPCPRPLDDTLECRSLVVDGLTVDAFEPLPALRPQRVNGSIELAAARVSPGADTLSLGLLWRFDAPYALDAVRFVHVLGADAQPAAQDDRALGVFSAGEGWLDVVEIAIDDLPPGAYRIRAGWYIYPDTTPLGMVDLGEFEVKP